MTDPVAPQRSWWPEPDFDTLAIWAVRYALGRMTFAVNDVCDVLIRNADSLRPTARRLILQDINEAKAKGGLGMDIDAMMWLQLADRLSSNEMTHDPMKQWNGRPLMRYRLIGDDDQFGLKDGDILLCEEMQWPWAREKVAVVRRESDGHDPGCSQYRHSVEYLGIVEPKR